MKINALLGYDRQNEAEAIKKSKSRRMMFIASILLGVAGMGLMVSRIAELWIPGALLITAFLYGFFMSFSSGVPAFFDKRPRLKYAGTNLLVYRSLAAKLTTMGVTMATIALLFTVTLLSEGSGLLFSRITSFRVETNVNYDVAVTSSYGSPGIAAYRDYIDANIPIKSDREYPVYGSGNDQIMRRIAAWEEKFYRTMYEEDSVLAAGDYAALRKMQGYPEITIGQGEYLIHCFEYMKDFMEGQSEPLQIGGRTLSLSGVRTEHFSQGYYGINGDMYILVVPDEVAKALKPLQINYVAMTEEPVSREDIAALESIQQEQYSLYDTDEDFYGGVYTMAGMLEEGALVNAVMVFPLFYLALILTMVSATILTIQLLSDTGRYQKQYALLTKLGMARKEMNRALRVKFALFYAMPAVPPVVICIIFVRWLGGRADAGTIVSPWHLWGMIGAALGIFFSVYLVYIAVSYTSFKRNVLGNV